VLMTEAMAVKWLEQQRDKGVQWDDDSPETAMIRRQAEEAIREAYNMAIDALNEKWKKEKKIPCKIDGRVYSEKLYGWDYLWKKFRYHNLVLERVIDLTEAGQGAWAEVSYYNDRAVVPLYYIQKFEN
jgi:hypothetical protein